MKEEKIYEGTRLLRQIEEVKTNNIKRREDIPNFELAFRRCLGEFNECTKEYELLPEHDEIFEELKTLIDKMESLIETRVEMLKKKLEDL